MVFPLFRQARSLISKDIRIRRKRKWLTFIECSAPFLFLAFCWLTYPMNMVGTHGETERIVTIRTNPISSIPAALPCPGDGTYNECTFAIVTNNINGAEQIAPTFIAEMRGVMELEHSPPGLILADEAELEEYIRVNNSAAAINSISGKDRNSTFVPLVIAVVFNPTDNQPYDYSIWANATRLPFMFDRSDLTSSLFYITNRQASPNGYVESGFLYVQQLVDSLLIAHATQNSSSDSFNSIFTYTMAALSTNLTLEAMADPPTPNFHLSAPIGIIYTFFGQIALIFFVPFVVVNIVFLMREREAKFRSLLLMLGVKSSMYALFNGISLFIGALYLGLLISLSLFVSPLFSNSNFWIMSLLFSLMTVNCMAFVVLATSLNRRTVLALAAALVWLLIFPLAEYWFQNLSLITKTTASILCGPLAFSFAFWVIVPLDFRGAGTQWDSLDYSHFVNQMTVLDCMVALAVNTVLLFILAWYLNNVMPAHTSAMTQRWYFPLSPSYWWSCLPTLRRRRRSKAGNEEMFGSKENSHLQCEGGVSSVESSVSIRNLSKTYSGSTDWAVQDLNLELHTGEIFVLLGCNGAGKSTTVSMLTGLIAPTSGDGIISGHSILDSIDEVHQDIGVCRQENCLYDELTAYDHLCILANLKDLSRQESNDEIYNVLLSVGIPESHYHRPVSTFSSGQKRMLSMALALLGDSTVVFLDEPTASMDPISRRQTWDLLLQEKSHRTIVLTTHYLDEADLLGDRIGIMAHGRLVCCDTPENLKKTFGTGYRLTFTKLSPNNGVRWDDSPISESSDSVTSSTTNSSSSSTTDRLLSAIRQFVPKANIIATNQNTITVDIPEPTRDDALVAALFRELEAQCPSLGLSHFDIASTTLEDVFLRISYDDDAGGDAKPNHSDGDDGVGGPGGGVGEGGGGGVGGSGERNGGTYHHAQYGSVSATDSDSTSLIVGSDGDRPDVDDDDDDADGCGVCDRFSARAHASETQRFLVLLRKSFLQYYREPSRVLVFVIMATVLSVAALIVSGRLSATLSDTYYPTKPLLMDAAVMEPDVMVWSDTGHPRHYGDDDNDRESSYISYFRFDSYEYDPGYNDDGGLPKFPRQLADVDLSSPLSGEEVVANMPLSQNVTLMQERNLIGLLYTVQGLMNGSVPHDSRPPFIPGGFSFASNSSTSTIAHTTIVFNHSVPLSIPAYMNQLSTSYLRILSNNNTATIRTSSQPFGNTSVYWGSDLGAVLSFTAGTWSLVVILCILFAVTALAYSAANEGIIGFKRQILLTGTRVSTYWASRLLSDFLVTAFCVAIVWVVGVIFAREEFPFFDRGFVIPFVVLCAFYTVALLLFNYCSTIVLSMRGFNPAISVPLSNVICPIVAAIAMLISVTLASQSSVLSKLAGIVLWHVSLLHPTPIFICTLTITDIMFFDNSGSWYDPNFSFATWTFGIPITLYGMLALGLVCPVLALLLAVCEWIQQIGNKHAAARSANSAHKEAAWSPAQQLPPPPQYPPQYQRNGEFDATHSSPPLAVEAMRACKFYPKSPHNLVLDDLTFSIPRSTCFGLLGANGAGKSTLTKMMFGALPLTSGWIKIEGEVVGEGNNKYYERGNIGVCGDTDSLLGGFTGRDHLEILFRLRKDVTQKEASSVARTALRQALMAPLTDRPANVYSIGNRRKLSFLMAILGGPSVVILDEPTSGIDAASRRALWAMLSQSDGEGRTTILATHSMEEADAMCDQIGLLVNGKFRCFGTPLHLKQQFSGYWVTLKLVAAQTDIDVNVERAPYEGERSTLDVENVETKPSSPTGPRSSDDFVADNARKPLLASNVNASINGPDVSVESDIGSTGATLGPSNYSDEVQMMGLVSAGVFDEAVPAAHSADALMAHVFPGAILVNTHRYTRSYFVGSVPSLSYAYQVIEANQASVGIESFSLTQPSLEQVFLRFGSEENIDQENDVVVRTGGDYR